MAFFDVISGIPGLVHYYPLATDAKDYVGAQHGVVNGVTFANGRAVFNGAASIDLGDHNDFSVATKGGLSIALFLTIDDWRGKGAAEYVHWAGKGSSGAHEWAFRHYVQGGTGEASTRKGRCSFYHFNASGGLGAGSFWEDSTIPTTERQFVATCDKVATTLYGNGVKKDSDLLSGYKIIPTNTASHAMLGTRGDGSGYLVGKIRRVAIYNRVLTAAEVAKIYAARDQPEVEPPPVVIPPPVQDPLLVSLEGDVTSMEVAVAHNALVKVLREKGTI